MSVYLMWHGGASYGAPAPEDAEAFPSIAAAVRAFVARADGDPAYPCVARVPPDSGPVGWLFIGGPHPRELADPYPDRVLEFGPRGGLRIIPA